VGQKVRLRRYEAHHFGRAVLGLESVKDAEVKVIQNAPLPVWANFRQRALDVAILEIDKKTDINIEIESLERSNHRRVTLRFRSKRCRGGD
jgi:hypothetical protein